jgi:hypothetical protein
MTDNDLERLGLSRCVVQVLKRAGIEDLNGLIIALCQCGNCKNLAQIKGIGRYTVRQIECLMDARIEVDEFDFPTLSF